MYEPPEKARDIPNNALPEWYIGASTITLLPDLKFTGGGALDKAAAADSEEKKAENKDPKKEAERVAKYENIGANSACGGSVMTLSFHVKQENVIKLYLYMNGQCIRFMPEDVKAVLPVLFNMEFGDNKQWIKTKEADSLIKQMNRGLKDEQF